MAFNNGFQENAFQQNAFQINQPLLITDFHDGDYKKRFDEEKQKASKKKQDIIDAYDFLVEGKSLVAQEIVKPFVKKLKQTEKQTDTNQNVFLESKKIDFNKMLKNLDKVEELWDLYLEMDDEDVLVLL
jgi:uncharacterized protein YpuA (DUF1002 family)